MRAGPEAFIDRLHGYLPGWEIPKIHPGSLAQDYGFITDYFCEIMHELRRKDVLGPLKSRYQLMDTSTAKAGITGRDVKGERLDETPSLRGHYIVLPNVSETGNTTLLRSKFKAHYKQMPCVGGYLDGAYSQLGNGKRGQVHY